MKNKQQHWAKASFALLIFVILGYVIRFYPQQLTGFDSTIQSAIRGDLPAALTAFFTKVTHVMDTKIIVIWVALSVGLSLPIRMVQRSPLSGEQSSIDRAFGSSSEEYLPETETKYSSSSRGKRLFFPEWSFTGVYPCFGKFDHHHQPTCKT